jgi:peptide/nickel transport system substrate-binding protein
MKSPKTLFILAVLLILVLSGCAPAVLQTETVQPPTSVVPSATVQPPTPLPPTATVDPEQLKIGGTLVIRDFGDPGTLDIHKSSGGPSWAIWWNLGASLIIKDPQTGEYLPYLAESWQILDGGLGYEFKLRQDVKFHDGTSLTAADYVATFERIMDPATMSPTAGSSMLGVSGVELVDDYTFRINMSMPNSSFLENLTNSPVFSPYSKAYLEAHDVDFIARNPMSVGPFKFKEYLTGERVVLERNPDFTWGPSFTHGGPAYIDTLEFRILPDDSTALAALEANELDISYLSRYQDRDVVEATGFYDVYQRLGNGSGIIVELNNSKPPFNDLNVRQAFNYAVDRQAILETVFAGNGSIQIGPITPAVTGYWPGVEDLAYGFDLEKAKTLMTGAGYTLNASGKLEKDGASLKLDLLVSSGDENFLRIAQILQQQFAALGVDIQLVQLESGTLNAQVTSGDYSMVVTGWGWSDYSLMYIYNSGMIGVLNDSQLNDPDLDQILNAMMFSGDQALIDQSIIDAQKYIVEKAITIPLVTLNNFDIISKRVVDEIYTPYYTTFWLIDAYIQQ